MMEGLLPPFVEPTGPFLDDATVVQAFARGERCGYSRWLHAEGPTLLVDRDIPGAIRLVPRAVLVRQDLPEGYARAVAVIEAALADMGLRLLDPETLLGVPVGLQVVGLRLSTWDLWGRDLDAAFAALRRTAAGDDCFLA